MRSPRTRGSAGTSLSARILGSSARVAAGAALAAVAAQARAAEEKRCRQLGRPARLAAVREGRGRAEALGRKHADRMRLEIAGTLGPGPRPVRDPAHRPADQRRRQGTRADYGPALRPGAIGLEHGAERSSSGCSPTSRRPAKSCAARWSSCLPIPDPDRYEAGTVSPVYDAWTLDGPRDPERSPEAMAVQTRDGPVSTRGPRRHSRHQPGLCPLHHVRELRRIVFERGAAPLSPRHHAADGRGRAGRGLPLRHGRNDGERLFWGPDVDQMRSKSVARAARGLRGHLLLPSLPHAGFRLRGGLGAERRVAPPPPAADRQRDLAGRIRARLPDARRDVEHARACSRPTARRPRHAAQPRGVVEQAPATHAGDPRPGGRRQGDVRVRHVAGGRAQVALRPNAQAVVEACGATRG